MRVLDSFLSYSAWMGVVPELHTFYSRLMTMLPGDAAPLESLRQVSASFPNGAGTDGLVVCKLCHRGKKKGCFGTQGLRQPIPADERSKA